LPLLVGALLWFPSSSGIIPKSTALWRGYQTLLVRADYMRGKDMSALVARLGPGVVSEATARIDFWDFTGLATATFAELNGRLDPQDPRRDRYIDGAAGYFHTYGGGVEWHLIYIPADKTSFRLWLHIARVLKLPLRGEWRLIDFDPLSKLLSLLAVFGLAVSFALAQEEGRRWALAYSVAGALLWTPFLFSGGFAQLAITVILLLTWFPLMRVYVLLREWGHRAFDRLRRPLLFYACAFFAGLLLTLCTGPVTLSSLVSFISPVLASLLFLPLVPTILRVAGTRLRRRTIFQPVPIVRSKGDTRRAGSIALLFVAVALVIISLFSFAGGPPLPTPVSVAGARDFSWNAIEKLRRVSRAAQLPDFLGLVTHAAFQETIAFGRPWMPPERDERVYVREFVVNPASGATVARQKTVKVFDATWLESVRRRSTPGSLEAMFTAQGRPVVVTLRGPGRVSILNLPAALLVLCVFLAWLRRDLGRGPLIHGDLLRLNSAARRNQAQ
jgi:hypothetical protein